jgi:hypothetical protein
MTSRNYEDLLAGIKTIICVPHQEEELSTLKAAILWAENGFYVLPIDPKTKHAGSVVGVGWPDKSSREPKQIESWFRPGTNYGIAVHLGKSGAIAFDVDDPSQMPNKLREWIMLENVPFQSTRTNDPLRGHYIFATPEGSSYGNSKGLLKGAWGEVRGKNGIIVVAPTSHSKHAEGGQYVWKRTGVVPLLPYALQRLLPESRYQSTQSIDMAEAETFFANYSNSICENVLETRLLDGKSWFLRGSRHDACRDLLLVCMIDTRAGLYGAKTAVESILNLFVSIKPQDQWSSPREFIDMTLWAIAQVLQISDEEIALHRESQLTINSPQIQDWINRHND